VRILNLLLFSIISITALESQEAFSQQIDWNLGNGLKQGDYFRYSMCHVDYNDCTIFETEFWINGIKQVGSETRWVAQTTVHDGNKIIKGEIELGKISPEPLGGSPELKVYRDAFKSSIAWISGFSKGYGDMKWGIGQRIEIHSDKTETVYTQAGVFDSRVIYWNDNNQTSKIWVADDFPFPVKADTWVPFSEEEPIQEFRFELLDYQQNVIENPFTNSSVYQPNFVTLTPLILYPQQNNTQIVTVDSAFLLENESVRSDIPYEIQIWKDGEMISSIKHAVENKIFSISLKTKDSDCKPSYPNCTEYVPPHKPDLEPIVSGDSEIKSPAFGKSGKYEVKIIFRKMIEECDLCPAFSTSPPITKSSVFEILDGSEKPSPEKSYLPKDDLEEGHFPPNTQTKNGILPKEVVCKEGFTLISKPFREIPACVFDKSVEKLTARGWHTDLGWIDFFSDNYEIWENSSCINLPFIEHLIFAFDSWKEDFASTEMQNIDYDGMSICEAENFVRNNLDDQFTIIGEMDSGVVSSVDTLIPHNSVWIDLILKDETKNPLEKNDRYRLKIGVSDIVKVNSPTRPALIWNEDKGWEEVKSPLKDKLNTARVHIP
jgi:hypothetical protein